MWSGIPISNLQFVVIHTIEGCSVVNEADVIFGIPLIFFYDPADVGSLISGYFAFSKSSLYIWKFSILLLLKPALKYFEPNLSSMRNEGIVW